MNTAVRADGERRPGEVGRPVDGVQLRIVTEDGSDAPADGETIGEGGSRPSERELSDHVAALLAPHKRPRVVHFVTELPRNAMGKVIKQQLVAP